MELIRISLKEGFGFLTSTAGWMKMCGRAFYRSHMAWIVSKKPLIFPVMDGLMDLPIISLREEMKQATDSSYCGWICGISTDPA